MKWTECAIQDLRDYNRLKASLENIPRRIEALRYKFEAVKGAVTDKVPVKGGSNHYEDSLLDNIVERERLKLTYDANKILVDLIERGLAALDTDERLVLYRFYVDRPRDHIEKLMEETNHERSWVYETKDRALNKFVKAMYGILEY